MKFSTILLGVALYLLSPVSAGITTNTPFASVTWEGGDDEDIVWVDDDKAPKLADIGITTIDLMMGNSTNQVFVANIAKVPATAKQVEYNVPENVGPVGNNYFIKYTAGKYTSFSGSFRIENVNGKAPAAPPTDPAAPPTAPTAPTAPTTPTAPDTTAADPKTVAGDPKAVVPDVPVPAGTPKSTGSSSAASPTPSTAQNNLPTPISSDASNLFPSFSGVAAAAVAFAFTYLY